MKLNPWPYFVGAILLGTLGLNITVYRAASSSAVPSVTANAYQESLALDQKLEARRRFWSAAPGLRLEIDPVQGKVVLTGVEPEPAQLTLQRTDSAKEDLQLTLDPTQPGRSEAKLPALSPGLRLLAFEFSRNGERYLYEGTVLLGSEPMVVPWSAK